MDRFYPEDIGKRIADIRKNNGENQKDFAKIMGVATSTLSYYELGKKDPTTKFLVKMADLYNADLHWLLTGDSQPTPKPKSGDMVDHGVMYDTLDTLVTQQQLLILGGDSVVKFGKEFIAEYEKFLKYKLLSEPDAKVNIIDSTLIIDVLNMSFKYGRIGVKGTVLDFSKLFIKKYTELYKYKQISN